MKLFNQKHRLFSRKIKDVTNSIFEVEFKIHKSRQMREESRLLRDRAVEQVGMIKVRVEAAPTPELEADLKLSEEAKEKYEGQMKMIDEQIHGTEEQPGLMDTLKGLTELREMYKSYLKVI